MKKEIPIFILFCWLAGCVSVRHAYYLSPTSASSHPYHAIPMQHDSLRSAWYGSMVFSTGTSNDQGNDNVWSFEARIHRSHNLGPFQAYYGIHAVLGNYDVAEYYRSKYYYLSSLFGRYPVFYDTTYHIPKTNSFYGNYGFAGGMNLVIPFEVRAGSGEWRVLGLETDVSQEFGDYLNFRKSLPDTAADIIFRKSLTGTWGIYTEIVGKNRHQTEFGFRLAYGRMFNPRSNFTSYTSYPNNTSEFDNSAPNIFPPAYLTMALHVTRKQVTGFIQVSGSSYSTSFQTGVNYRFGAKKQPG